MKVLFQPQYIACISKAFSYISVLLQNKILSIEQEIFTLAVMIQFNCSVFWQFCSVFMKKIFTATKQSFDVDARFFAVDYV